ncbi:SpoIIE family protein phosphatase [Marinilabiliaceae bacterium ANBcel2]|nr:SpoIIE family protein phosphatase [Marinilabiliaceae bacterium ANBcel2]
MYLANENSFLDIFCEKVNHHGEMVCGDVFLSRRYKEEGRTIIVLSDGMGSGIKANVLASITASMALNFTLEHREVCKSAKIIMDTLPVCSQRGTSYSTFTIVDIEDDGYTTIVEYDNPGSVILREDTFFDPGWEKIPLESEKYKNKHIKTCSFYGKKEDRILFWSDGVVQAGMGSKKYPYGWGRDAVLKVLPEIITGNPAISSSKLARRIVSTALRLDGGDAKDDTSAAVVYFREPRKLLLVSGPPFNDKTDHSFAKKVERFDGKKIIAGGTTAQIIARELSLHFEQHTNRVDSDLPPISYIQGIDLVTEGILTLSKVLSSLEEMKSDTRLKYGAADQIVRLFIESDRIHIINGTRINMAHQDPELPFELEMRKSIIKRLVTVLESKFLKEVTVEYV